MNRRGFLRAAAVTMGAAMAPIIVARLAAAYTVRQLIAACRLWLKRHHVRRYATVAILNGVGAPPRLLLEPAAVSGWRWAPDLDSWVSPAFDVSWSSGATVPSFTSPFEDVDVQMYVGPWTVEGNPAIADLEHAGSLGPFGLLHSGDPGQPSAAVTAASSGSGVAFVAQRALQSGSVVNIVPNPSFETGTGGWSALSATLSQTSDPQFGTSSLTATSTGAGTAVVADLTGASPNTAYNVSMFHRSRSGYGSLTVSVADVIADGTVGAYTTIGTLSTNTGARFSGVYTSGSAAVGIRVRITGTGAVGSTFTVDAVQATKGSRLYAYFDGDTDDTAMYQYDWVGTRGSSASTRTLVGAPVSASEPVAPDLAAPALLGGDFTVDSTFTYPPDDVAGAGDDGDYWLDTAGKAMYGPKASGDWPADPAVEGLNLTRLVR